MPRDFSEFVKPSRTGRMTGVNITIDGDTWEYVLENAGIPLDTPLSEIKIKRYRTRDGRIILKIMKNRDFAPNSAVSPVGVSMIPPSAATAQNGANAVSVSETSDCNQKFGLTYETDGE